MPEDRGVAYVSVAAYWVYLSGHRLYEAVLVGRGRGGPADGSSISVSVSPESKDNSDVRRVMDVNEAVENQEYRAEYHRHNEGKIRSLQEEVDKLRSAYDWASNAASLLVLTVILGGAIIIVTSWSDTPKNSIVVGVIQVLIGIFLTAANTRRIRQEQKSQ